MKTSIILLIACCFLVYKKAAAQNLFSAIDNTITVYTKNSPTGNTDVIEVSLPAKTQEFIYRISIFKKDQWKTGASLSTLLDSIGVKNVSHTYDFRQLSLTNNDHTIASAFIFSNAADADNFYYNKAGWRACKNLLRINSACSSSRQCIGKKIYFGFSNGNIVDDLDIRLEVVAVSGP